jgi:hypothetical protein
VDELRRHGIDESRFEINKEVKIFGSHKVKKVDIAVTHPVNGPQLLIGVRSQMSSVHNNLLTYYQEIIGDVISLHDRFPMCVIGYVYLLPTEPLKTMKRPEYIDLSRAARLFKQITGRVDFEGHKHRYEHFAFLPVDFTVDPPQVRNDLLRGDLKTLRINNFFQKMIETWQERNIFLSITE